MGTYFSTYRSSATSGTKDLAIQALRCILLNQGYSCTLVGSVDHAIEEEELEAFFEKTIAPEQSQVWEILDWSGNGKLRIQWPELCWVWKHAVFCLIRYALAYHR